MVGINGTTEVTFLNRQQWVGIDGAPQTTFLSVGIPEIGKNLAAGLSFFDDKIGPSVETNFAADFSYKVKISERFLLNMGLKSSLNILNVDFTKLSAYDPNDYALSYNVSKVTPNFGVGFTLYDKGKFFSVSIPKILETSHFNSNKDSEIFLAKEKNSHLCFSG